eukprot:GHVP01050337.1.p2 GENE.GHVP01050337.1~~GHVP01050337.1.p2  ORF type:complete len:689 (-),score=131.86 GHVP01050337.1:2186-4252(-)
MWLLNAVGLVNKGNKGLEVDEAKVQPYCSIKGTFYAVDGLESEVLSELEEFQVTKDHILVGDPDENDEAKWTFRMENVLQFQRHQDDMLQFSYKKNSNDCTSFGVQTETPLMAFNLFRLVMKQLFALSDWEFYGKGSYAMYDSSTSAFIKVADSVLCGIKRMSSGNSSDRYLAVTSESDVPLFFELIGHQQQLWVLKESLQLSFWGRRLGDDVAHTYLVEYRTLQNSDSSDESEDEVDNANELNDTKEQPDKLLDLIQSIIEDATGIIDQEMLSEEEDEESSDHECLTLGEKTKSIDSGESENSSDEDEDEDEEEEDYYKRKPILYKDPTYASSENTWNQFMRVGSNRTFVYRSTNSKLGQKAERDTRFELAVFGPEAEMEGIKDVATIGETKFLYNGEKIIPKSMLLHDGQRKIIVSSAVDTDKAYLMDLETEKVVQQFDAQFQGIHKMVNSFKGGDDSTDPTFLCHNSKNIFMMDTRQEFAGRTNTLTYAKKQGFSVIATDESGHFAVGSTFGTIRLFDGEEGTDGKFKRAKTQIDIIKDPIIGLDVTDNGQYVIATTKSYLVLLDVRSREMEGKTGFEVSLRKGAAVATVLQMNRDDVMKLNISSISLTPAKFDGTEQKIMTSTGNLILLFDFKAAKRRKVEYEIQILQDYIKDVNSTKSGSQQDVVVAYPKDVGIVKNSTASRR